MTSASRGKQVVLAFKKQPDKAGTGLTGAGNEGSTVQCIQMCQNINNVNYTGCLLTV